MYRIMIVEDDEKIANILAGYLQKYGYTTGLCQDFEDVLGEFLRFAPHLVLLDINLPYMDGFYWCRQIRVHSKVPVIFISARDSDLDQVLALDRGGDDYLTKPFSLDVVLAKVRAALRRSYGEYALEREKDLPVIEAHGLYLHRSRGSLHWEGREVFLSPKECLLLEVLLKRLDQVVPRQELLELLWDDVEFVDDNTLTVNVTRLRRKLAELGIRGAVETVRGAGYRLRPLWADKPDR